MTNKIDLAKLRGYAEYVAQDGTWDHFVKVDPDVILKLVEVVETAHKTYNRQTDPHACWAMSDIAEKLQAFEVGE